MTPASGPSRDSWAGLVADIGGTHVRMALVDSDGSLQAFEKEAHASVDSPVSMVRRYLERHAGGRPVARAVLAVAGPVEGNSVTMPNRGWTLSARDFMQGLSLDAHFVNDLEALAYALPTVGPDHLVSIGRADADPSDEVHAGSGAGLRAGTRLVIAAGTGFGASALIPCESGGWVALAGEAGHATLPVSDEFEREFATRMRERHGRCSIERALSGTGIEELYLLAASRDGAAHAPRLTPEQVAAEAHHVATGAAARAMDTFWALLGTVAGDLALTVGARGGVYVGGGIASGQIDSLRASRFRDRFQSKGRFKPYVSRIRTHVIVHEAPALLGAAALL